MNKMQITKLGGLCAAILAIMSLVPIAAEAATRPSDTDISSAIETNLLLDSAVAAPNIDVYVDNGIVRLTGSAYNLLACEKATAIAENIKGVRSVVNEIQVIPVARSDEEIRTDVSDALRSDPATGSYGITAKVDGGAVTLSGQVDSYAEKQLCEEVAKGVKGVRAVKDDIQFLYENNRPDGKIEEEVEALLQDDVRINADGIAVKVKDGKVTLSGIVGSAAEKSRAADKGWVAGVREVNTDDLRVDWWALDAMKRESPYEYRTDDKIDAAVKDALMQDPRVWSFEVKPEAEHGVVTLTGTVGNLKAKEAAEQDAKNTVGVWRVKDYLKVRPKTLVSDSDLIANVRAALARDPYIDRHDITVSALNGKAYLYGTVDSDFEKNRAEEVAARASGVIDVENLLAVRNLWSSKSDLAIRQDIQDQLYWDGLVDEAKMEVGVHDGVATLTGTVDTWYQYAQAAEDARAGGAKEIRNQLHVKDTPPKFKY